MRDPDTEVEASPILEVRDLKTVFRMRAGTATAVNRVSFAVRKGESFGIVGESGSGKSLTCLSILRCLPASAQIESGEVWWLGENLLTKSEAQMRRIRGGEISYIPQDPTSSLNPVLTIGSQLEETIAAHGESSLLGRWRRRSQSADLLRSVGIPHPKERLRAFPHELSGGMKQRALVAIALSTEPKLIIADEPTSNLDATIQAQVLDLLKQVMVDYSVAMIFVTHDFSVVAQMCDMVGVMYGGSMMEIAPVSTLLEKAAHPYTKALLAAVPRMDARQDRLVSIEGQVPDITALGRGCPFASRCPVREVKCDDEYPPTIELGRDHQATCWKC